MLLEITTAEAIAELVHDLYGNPLRGTGIILRLDAWRGPADCLVALRRTPPPSGDLRRLVRGLSWARADAIVTTLEDIGSAGEARSADDLDPSLDLAPALAAWRRNHLGRQRSPVTLVVDPRGEVDLDHPILGGRGRRFVYTTLDGMWALESRAADRGVEVVAADSPDPAGAIRFLRRELGAATVVLETRPTVLAECAGQGCPVDELMLVVYEASRLASEAEGPWVLPIGELRSHFSSCPDPSSPDHPENGEWSVCRWLR